MGRILAHKVSRGDTRISPNLLVRLGYQESVERSIYLNVLHFMQYNRGNHMVSLKKALAQTKKDRVAIGHFNISDLAALKAIFEGARELSAQVGKQLPIIIGLSEGERGFVGTVEAAGFVQFLRKAYDYPIFINADHTHSLEKCVEAAKAGFDEIIFDGSKLSMDENIAKTKEVIAAVKAINKKILIEGEIGYIGSGSEILKEIPAGAAIKEEDITKPEEAERFVAETGVDLLAPAVGNIHGMFAGAPNPHLFIKAIKKIKRAAKRPIVLHGGSGTPDEDFIKAIEAGVSVIHINTELRRAWRVGVETALTSQPDEVAPAKLLVPAYEGMKQLVIARLKLFNRIA